jgi:hypothetical protein
LANSILAYATWCSELTPRTALYHNILQSKLITLA